MSHDLVFTVEFNIKPESRDAFLKGVNHVVEEMAKESTFITTYFHQDSEDPDKFFIYERWSEPSMDAFMKNQLQGKAYRDDYEKRLPEWSKEPRKIRVLNPLGEWLSQ